MVRGVLITTNTQQSRWGDAPLREVTSGSSDWLVLTGFQMEGRHMSEDPLASEPAATDPLTLFRHKDLRLS